MPDAARYLPHDPPAIMLESYEEGPEGTLRGAVCLNRCKLLWMTEAGLPSAFGIEILGQLSAVYLRRRDTADRLEGGRLASIDHFTPLVTHLPGAERLGIEVRHLGGSSVGFHKFEGTIRSASGATLATAVFSVMAFYRE